eukprot:scaffold16100_cov20-Tisochrysis_lutea.AAC.5
MACSHSFIPWHAAKHDEHCQQHAITPCTQHDIVTMVCNQDKHQAAQKGTSPVLDPHAPIQAACIGECLAEQCKEYNGCLLLLLTRGRDANTEHNVYHPAKIMLLEGAGRLRTPKETKCLGTCRK